MIVINDIGKHLQENGIKPSIQRIKVFEFLMNSMDHPNVDQIYMALSPKIPTLSKTTVYNTLHLFRTQGIVNAVHIEDNEIRYDCDTSFHGHFKCNICGTLMDFRVSAEQLQFNEISGNKITESHFYLKGICNSCLNAK